MDGIVIWILSTSINAWILNTPWAWPIAEILHFMGLSLLLGSMLIAYCASFALPAGADFRTVFRVFAAIGFAAYGWANIPYSIWFGFQWSITVKYLVDALIYGLVTAATFAWLWPTPG